MLMKVYFFTYDYNVSDDGLVAESCIQVSTYPVDEFTNGEVPLGQGMMEFDMPSPQTVVASAVEALDETARFTIEQAEKKVATIEERKLRFLALPPPVNDVTAHFDDDIPF